MQISCYWPAFRAAGFVTLLGGGRDILMTGPSVAFGLLLGGARVSFVFSVTPAALMLTPNHQLILH